MNGIKKRKKSRLSYRTRKNEGKYAFLFYFEKYYVVINNQSIKLTKRDFEKDIKRLYIGL